jgi:hypothetical protein
MTETWSDELLLNIVETAFRDAGVAMPDLDIGARLRLQRSLLEGLKPYQDMAICEECGRDVEYGGDGDAEPDDE